MLSQSLSNRFTLPFYFGTLCQTLFHWDWLLSFSNVYLQSYSCDYCGGLVFISISSHLNLVHDIIIIIIALSFVRILLQKPTFSASLLFVKGKSKSSYSLVVVRGLALAVSMAFLDGDSSCFHRRGKEWKRKTSFYLSVSVSSLSHTLWL